MLSVPDANITESLGLLREGHAAGVGFARRPAGGDEGQIQDGQSHGHGPAGGDEGQIQGQSHGHCSSERCE